MSGSRLDTRKFVPMRADEIEDSLSGRFTRQVHKHGDRLAVKYGAESLTYEELDRLSNRIANALLTRCGHDAQPIVLLFEQGIELVGGILAVLKAGKFYVPLDPTDPVPRLLEVVEDVEPAAILTDAHNLSVARALGGEGRLVLEVAALASASASAPTLPVGPDALAYVFFTSGSTGRPKGVVDRHRNVLHNVMRYTNNLSIAEDDRLTLLQSASFSGTVSSLFGALLNGAAIFPYDLRREGLGPPLASWIRRERVTIYHSVPTIFRSVLDDDASFPDVRIVRLEGDAATTTDVGLHHKHFPASVLAIGLGATETGLSCQLLLDRATSIEGFLPIGFPTSDMRLSVRDAADQPLPPDHVGELMVTSPYLALGYWRRPELTAAAFAPGDKGPDDTSRTYRTGDLARIRADGCVEYVGRKDHRLKIHGHTVEAGDVEAALLRTGLIREAAVTTHEDATGTSGLVAYVIPTAPETWNASEARAVLARSLPAHMVPRTFVTLARLPVTATGKVDRASLRPPPSGGSIRPRARRPARDDLEATLASVWAKTLGLSSIGIDEDFRDLGGDSLLAARASIAIDRRVGRKVPADAVLAHGNVEVLARAIRQGLGLPPRSPIVALRTEGAQTPFFFLSYPFGGPQRFAPLASRLGSDRPFYVIRPLDEIDFANEELRLESLAARRIRDLAGVQPHGPYLLGGACYGAVVAFEMARQLRAAGEEVALLALSQITAFDFPSLVSPLALWRYQIHQALGRHVAHLTARLSHHRQQSLEHPGGRLRHVADTVERASWRLAGRMRERWTASRAAAIVAPVRIEEQAFQAYVPRRYSGDVLLVLSEAETRPYARDPRAAWKGLALGQVTVQLVEGQARWLFDEPEVLDVGDILRRELARADASSSAGTGA